MLVIPWIPELMTQTGQPSRPRSLRAARGKGLVEPPGQSRGVPIRAGFRIHRRDVGVDVGSPRTGP